YILSWTIIYLYTSGITSNMMQLRDILLGCLIVLVLPERLFNKIEKLIKSNVASNEIVYDYIMRSKNLTNSRLNSIYKTYDDLADTFDKIREKDKVLDQRDIANVIDMIHNDECKSCSMRRMCWESRFNHTYTMIYNILEKIEEKGELSLNDIPKNFRKECMKPESIVKISNHYYKMFVLDYDWSVKFSESRKLIANQIRSISKSIKSLSQDLEGDIMLDIEKEKNIYEQLERYDITVDKVSYLTKSNSEFEISIEKKTCHDGCMCEDKIVNIISDLVGENMSVRKIGCHCLGGKCKATFVKSQKYKAVTEVSAMSRDGHILCGDNYTYMEINDGKYMMAISDGMGKGKKAYEESSATIDILEKMIDAKIKDEIVIDTINNMLLLKSSEEMFSTLDLGILDLKRGCLETIKMGACSTYIKREDGEVDLISSSSLPVGILSDVKIDRKNVKVKEGDYVIMVSDGIVDAGRNNNLGDNWLIYFLKNIETTNPKEISNLMEKALENKEFFMCLQPKIDIKSGKISGAESLVRWKNSEKGIIYPSDFIPLFEKSGFICKLDLYILEETCKLISKWIKEGKEVLRISVNVSRQHLNDKLFLEKYKLICNKYNVPTYMIDLELTESIFLENPEAVDVIDDIHSNGFKCSIDDF
ncbi:EAL domain-containing protein, partial [Clostridium paraputrificum]|nr:EAL domain-containing protein [Clostridium paraputrificum]